MKLKLNCKECNKEIELMPFKIKKDGNLCFQCKLKVAWAKRLEGKDRSTDRVKVLCKKCGKELGRGNGILRCTIKAEGNLCGSCINKYVRNYKPHSEETKNYLQNNNGRKLKTGESSFNRAVSHTKLSAKKRGFEYNLTNDEFRTITSSNCHYCGAKPNNECKNGAKGDSGTYVYNGIDRVNPEKGYILDNCVPCCKTCNWAKGTKSIKEFNEWKNQLVFNSLINEPINYN